MDYTKTRGWRNKNPLNIELTDADWQGLADRQTDGRFCQFIHMSFGYRAAMKIFQSYYRRARTKNVPFTLDFIVRRWCPDGHEEGYLRSVEAFVPLGRFQRLPEPKSGQLGETFVRILGGMTRVECGCPKSDIPWGNIRGGYWLAFHIKPSGDAPQDNTQDAEKDAADESANVAANEAADEDEADAGAHNVVVPVSRRTM